MTRPIHEIAQEIRSDWKNVYFGAKPYLGAMRHLDSVEDTFYDDDARSVIAYFLANAQTWRGETAKHVKLELKKLLK
jgi:hypothetical protein